MPSEAALIAWHDRDILSGVDARIAYFHPASAQGPALLSRLFPFADTREMKVLWVEQDRRNFRAHGVVAQPDGVIAYKNGLISMEYKTKGGREINPQSWRDQVRLKDMLQCLLGGFAVAQDQRKTTACILRYENAALLLVPDPRVIGTMLELVPMAREYHGEKRPDIASGLLAGFSETRIGKEFGERVRASEAYGKKAHDDLFRMD